MINVKNHAKQRYCERILGITEKAEWQRYLADKENDTNLIVEVSEWVEKSNFIYRGQLGDNTTKVFRIYDNIVLVLDSQQTVVVTMFKCSFDFGLDMDRIIIAHEINTIEQLHIELDAIDAIIEHFVENKKLEISTIDVTIKALESQIASLRTQKHGAEAEIASKKSTRDFAVKEIEKRAVRICNSNDYRKDLNANAS